MIELRRIVLVNWHLLATADLDLAGDSAILGQNRSGKSTLIDLIQTVIAGGSARFYKYNSSAGEGGGRSERSLASYCLGQLNEDSFLRNEARSHIALVFEGEEAPPVSIGLTIEAVRGQAAEVVGRFVAVGASLDSGMLLEDTGTGMRPVSWAELRKGLEQACAEAGGQLHTPDDARGFIREYMREIFTGRRSMEPERFARTFVAALSFSDMRSLEDFVLRYLLEKKDIDIAELRASIQRYREIQKTIADLQRRLGALQEIRGKIEAFEKARQDQERFSALEQLAQAIEAGAALLKHVRELRARTAGLEAASRELMRIDAAMTEAEQGLDDIRRQLAASDAAGQRAIVEAQLRELERHGNGVSARLQARYLGAGKAMQLLERREKLGVLNAGELFRALEAVQAASQGLAAADWPRDPGHMETLLAAVGKAAASRIPKATERRDEAIAWVARLSGELRENRARLKEAQAGKVMLQAGTQRLMEVLRREGMEPRTLCEVAEIVDERWRGAVEALLVRDRETIIVEAEHAARAVEILRRGRSDFPGCRVANTRRLLGAPAGAEPGMLASMLRSPDVLAMAFAVFRIGNVRMAEDQAMLLAGGRAVMADGAYYDGLVTEMRRAEEFKIGRAAAPLMEASLARRVQEDETSLQVHQQTSRFFDGLIKSLQDCAQPVAEADRLEVIVRELDGLNERRNEARLRLEGIAAMTDPALAQAETRLKAELAELRQDRQSLTEQRAAMKAESGVIRQRMAEGEKMLGSALCFRQRWRRLRESVPKMLGFATLRAAYRALGVKTPARIMEEMAVRARAALDQHRMLEHEIRNAMGQYALQFPDVLEGYGSARILGDILPWAASGIEALEGNELIRYQGQADAAAARVTRLFRTTFIHELNSRFGAMQADMEALAKALRSRPLHGETYRLVAKVRPEFEDLHWLARNAEHDEAVLGSLFEFAAPRDDRHARALRQIEQLFADDTQDFSVHQDYRRYFSYDLQMTDRATGRVTSFDKRRNVASGAERQVPFYVVIGAALASIYHGARQVADMDRLGMGLAVFDEAFSKMDGPNQRTLLDFYRAIGLQVVIAAPTEKRAVVYENLDYIIDVFRNGDAAMAESLRIKERVREAMRAANPRHLTDEALAARVGEAEAAE